MPTAAPNARNVISVTSTDAVQNELETLARELGWSKKKVVNLAIMGFRRLSPGQRADLLKKHPLGNG